MRRVYQKLMNLSNGDALPKQDLKSIRRVNALLPFSLIKNQN